MSIFPSFKGFERRVPNDPSNVSRGCSFTVRVLGSSHPPVPEFSQPPAQVLGYAHLGSSSLARTSEKKGRFERWPGREVSPPRPRGRFRNAFRRPPAKEPKQHTQLRGCVAEWGCPASGAAPKRGDTTKSTSQKVTPPVIRPVKR